MRQPVDCPYLADVRAHDDGELAEARAAALQAHLPACPICQAEERALERLSAVLQQGDVERSLPKLEQERLKTGLMERCARSLTPTPALGSLPSCSRPQTAPRPTIAAWVPAIGVVACTVIVGAILLPVFGTARERARRSTSMAGRPLIASSRRATGSSLSPEPFLQEWDAPNSTGAPPLREAEAQVQFPASIHGGSTKAPQPRAGVLVGRSLGHSIADGHLLQQTAGKPIIYNPNAYLSSTYIGGTGARDRLEKLIREGVVVQGRRVRLEAFARSYAQPFPIPTRTALNLIAGTERTKIVEEGGRTYLQVGLQAMKGELPRRPPLNLALVIDCSGSMADEQKLEFAKAAALRLVDQLRPDDTLALVAFDDTARLLIPAGRVRGKARVKAEIAALTPGSGTNIYDALRLGHQEARRYATPDTVNRVILLSDGEVTAGVTDLHQFEHLVSTAAEHDVQTTTVGMGVDFDEELMLAVAREGQGNYHFLREAADTQRVFAQELDELTHVVAKAIRLRVRLADGVGLVRVLGAATLDAGQARQVKAEEKRIDRKVYEELGIAPNRQREPEEPGLKLLVPSFYRGDHHVVMLELALPPGRGHRTVADVYLKYKDLLGRSNRTAQTAVGIEYTLSREEMIASIDRGVKKNLLGFETGEALTEASSLIQQGKIAEAVRKIDERMVVLGVAAREWQDRDLDRDGRLLDRYKIVLSQLNRQPQLASGDLGQYLKKSLTYAGYNLTR